MTVGKPEQSEFTRRTVLGFGAAVVAAPKAFAEGEAKKITSETLTELFKEFESWFSKLEKEVGRMKSLIFKVRHEKLSKTLLRDIWGIRVEYEDIESRKNSLNSTLVSTSEEAFKSRYHELSDTITEVKNLWEKILRMNARLQSLSSQFENISVSPGDVPLEVAPFNPQST